MLVTKFVFPLLICLALVFTVNAEVQYETLEGSPLEKQLIDGFKKTDIVSFDGIKLKSLVFDPKPANEKNPLIIFISSWGVNKWEYVIPANDYAKKGYTIVSYTARGFWGSGGEINLAGEKDMSDIKTVIDWALANTNADPNRIGLSGISYGGGISLLASAFDSRVKSVAAMSCWVDMAESFLGSGETIRKEAAFFLKALARLTGDVGDDLEMVFDDYFANTDLQYLYTYTYNSSSVNFIDNINRNNPSIFIANAYGDSLFTPNQFPNFFEQLTTNKHMEFAPGDHAGPELPGLIGLPNQVWKRAGEWNDYYLLNGNTGADGDMPLVVLNSIDDESIEAYSSWESVTNSYQKFKLEKNEQLTDLSGLRGTSGDLTTITTGEDANINGGIAFVTQTVRAYIDVLKKYEMATIRRKHGAVFESDRLKYSMRIRGIPELSLNIVPQASNGTLIVYFLDVDNLNFGKLFAFSLWTFKNVAAGQPLTVDIKVAMTSYDIEPGNRLAIVVSSRDPLYLDQSPEGKTIAFEAGSVLTIPLHN